MRSVDPMKFALAAVLVVIWMIVGLKTVPESMWWYFLLVGVGLLGLIELWRRLR